MLVEEDNGEDDDRSMMTSKQRGVDGKGENDVGGEQEQNNGKKEQRE